MYKRIEEARNTKQCILCSTRYLNISGINLVAFGLELCASAGFTYIPPLLLKNGFTEFTLTILMGIGPFISLLTVPVIGHWSDRCHSPYGRRRPFILVLGLLMLLSLLIIPFNREISIYSFDIVGEVFILIFGVILLDFSSQALMNPAKSLIPDILKTSEEQNLGFTIYSCMLSLGGCVGYLASSINWTETQIGHCFGSQEKTVFCVLALIFAVLLIVNLNLAVEIPFEQKLSINGHVESNNSVNLSLKERDFKCDNKNDYFSTEILNDSDLSIDYNNSNSLFLKFSKILKEMKCFVRKCVKFLFFCASFPMKSCSSIKFTVVRFFTIPPALFNLFISNLFAWMGIMCHDLYYTDFVGQVIYEGKPEALSESLSLNLYNEGVRMGSWGLLLHCLSAAIYAAFIQEPLILKFGQRFIYLFGLITFSLSLFGTAMTKNIFFVNCFAAVSGTGLAVITTVPYSLVAKYYSKKDFQVAKDRGVGEDLAVLDSAFYLGQIIPSFFLGCIINITGSPSTYMFAAALCSTIACAYSFFIQF